MRNENRAVFLMSKQRKKNPNSPRQKKRKKKAARLKVTKSRWHLWLCNDKQVTAKALTASICGTAHEMFGVRVSREAEHPPLAISHNFCHSMSPGRQSRILQDWFAVPQTESHSSPLFSATSSFALTASPATSMHTHYTPPS